MTTALADGAVNGIGNPGEVEMAEQIAAVIVEPLSTSTVSLNVPFLAALRELCTELDVPLVFGGGSVIWPRFGTLSSSGGCNDGAKLVV